MGQYAIAFDLDTKAMTADGVSDSERTRIYQTEIPEALGRCGFNAWLQGSVYATDIEGAQLPAIMRLQSVLQRHAPQFCRYVNRVHIFRMEEWSDVTEVIADRAEVQSEAAGS